VQSFSYEPASADAKSKSRRKAAVEPNRQFIQLTERLVVGAALAMVSAR
jgi:hypothetical protein